MKTIRTKYRIFCAALLITLLLCGCGESAQEDTLAFRDNGQIRAVYVSAFPSESYNVTLLEEEIREACAAYNEAAGSRRISLTGISSDGSTASVSMRYASYEDYNAFNSQHLYYGTAQDGVDGGILPEDVRVKSADGSDQTTLGQIARDERNGEGRFRVIACDISCVIKHSGTPLYISDQVSITDEGVLYANPDLPEDTMPDTVYVVYKR